MLRSAKMKWLDPLKLANGVSKSNYQESWIFLYSGLHESSLDSKSYLCLFPKKEIIAEDFIELERELKFSNNKYYGYLSYNLKNQLEELSKDQESFINLPDLWMIDFNIILEFDHDKKEILEYVDDQFEPKDNYLEEFLHSNASYVKKNYPVASNLQSNFGKKEYLEKVEEIRSRIKNGDIYQANLTRKFFGTLSGKEGDDFDIFLNLTKKSPANYSAFLKLGKNSIISSSPELFIQINQEGRALSSPIKGTTPRSQDLEMDNLNKSYLENSTKEQAENLMIVDLVRNDLSKNCLIDSVAVKNLFKVSSYKTLHHLSSDIVGQKNPQVSDLSLIKGCFPAGSMTGAPKIKAMEICSTLEKQNRGVYSGAIGWIGSGDEGSNLSVVIRTIIIQDDKFEFQVGGAITFDSDANSEWQETMDKSSAIIDCLGIDTNSHL